MDKPRPTSRPLDRALNLGLVVLLLGVGVVCWERAARGEFDFEHFYLDGRYVWTHGELNPNIDDPDPGLRRRLPFYLPVVPLLVSPLTALGPQSAALLWAVMQVAALGLSLRVLRNWSVGAPRGVAALAVALLLALPALLEAAKFNQLSFVVLALVLGALHALERNRAVAAGALLGLASVLKFLPGIFVIWLLGKRRWSAAGALVLSAILISVVPPLVAFGPRRTLEYHRQWWQYNVRGDAAAGLLNAGLREHFIDQRNQSIAQVIARLAWPEHPYAAPYQPLHLDRTTCAGLAWGVGGLGLAGLVWWTRRGWNRLSREQLRAEAAVYAIAMIVFSPLLRQYYLVWALPGLVLLAQAAVREGGSRWARLGLAIWALGMLAWLWPLARLLGVHLLMLVAMGICLLGTARQLVAAELLLGRRPTGRSVATPDVPA